ncbi:MAG: hypothetical protein SangKO_080740 [Sandaracinaceae bacterium]
MRDRARVRALARLQAQVRHGPGEASQARRSLPPALQRLVRRAVAPVRVPGQATATIPLDARPAPLRAETSEGPPRASIVIPSRGAPTLAQCLAAIASHTRVPHEVIVVDDAAPSPLCGARTRLAARRGFPGAVNRGAQLARADALVILNDDVVVTPGWLTQLLAALELPKAGLVGPATNDSGDAATEPARYRDLEGLLAHARSREGAPREVEKLSLLCAAMRRETFEALGGLDEGYGLGMFEDDELCMSLRRRRLRVLLAPSAFVHHHGSATFGRMPDATRIARFLINRRRFERRWGVRWRAPTV